MATYKPRIVKTPEGLEQRFSANSLYVGPTYRMGLIVLGELKHVKGKELRYGTGIHSLNLLRGRGTLNVHFNDAANACKLDDIERIGLSPTSLCVVFVAKRGLYSGRIRQSPEIFDNDNHEPARLGAVRVAMKPTPTQLKHMTSILRAAARDKLVIASPK